MTTRSLPDIAGVKALAPKQLAAYLHDLGEPAFRVKQLIQWLYKRAARSYDEMSDLPAGLRETLASRLALFFPEVVARAQSEDGTRKYVVRLADDACVETVGLPSPDGRLTVCFSTQVGCGMGCAFCATGMEGFTRNLGPGEMADQINVVAQDFGMRVTGAVAMGQGEPFANYDNTLGGLRFLNAPEGLGIGARHLTVSTCGIIGGIRKLATEPEQFTLAVSLHSAIQEVRDRLMPAVARYPLTDLRTALIDYAEKTHRRPSLEYALIDGVNDRDEDLEALAAFSRGMLCHVNLIPMNPVAISDLHRSERSRVRAFEQRLSKQGTEVSIRAERGADIDAACGQLKQTSAEH